MHALRKPSFTASPPHARRPRRPTRRSPESQRGLGDAVGAHPSANSGRPSGGVPSRRPRRSRPRTRRSSPRSPGDGRRERRVASGRGERGIGVPADDRLRPPPTDPHCSGCSWSKAAPPGSRRSRSRAVLAPGGNLADHDRAAGAASDSNWTIATSSVVTSRSSPGPSAPAKAFRPESLIRSRRSSKSLPRCAPPAGP